jgi:probable rRNA maturation factor
MRGEQMELVFSGIDSSGRELMPGLSGAAVREQKDIIEDGRAADVFPSENIMLNMEKAAAEILAGHGITNNNIEISVTFVDENEIRQLNRMYRDIDKATDVLSFPQFYGPEDIPEEGPAALGDVVICNQRAIEQAEEYGHSTEREYVYLFVHSILHLLGYDHMDDDEKQQMRSAEEQIMNTIGLVR